MNDTDFPPEPGWEIYENTSPFSAPFGRMYHKFEADGTCKRAFRAKVEHTNGLGIVHGGMLASFMDALLGTAALRACRTRALTTRLTTEYLSIARPGNWIEGCSRVTNLTASEVYVEGAACVGARQLIKAQGVFRIMRARKGNS